MPFTYLAHQAPALAIKRRWPAFCDGTALAIGSMAPDWAYALSGSRWAFDAHSVQGVIGFCIPATVVAALVLRSVAAVLFAHLPSPRLLPLRQLRMLGARRPGWLMTLASAALGAFSHVAWDLFTHNDRWGPRHIPWLRSTALSVAGHDLTWAKVLQYTSHAVGSVVALVLLGQILRSGARQDAPEWTAATSGRGILVTATAVGTVAGGFWALGDPGLPAMIIRLSLGFFAGVVSGCVMLRWRWGSSDAPPG